PPLAAPGGGSARGRRPPRHALAVALDRQGAGADPPCFPGRYLRRRRDSPDGLAVPVAGAAPAPNRRYLVYSAKQPPSNGLVALQLPGFSQRAPAGQRL